MLETIEKVTAQDSPAATGEGQSPSQKPELSVTDSSTEINDDFEMDRLRRLLHQVNSPDYLHTVSLTELYDTVYQPKAQIVEGLLCFGVYLFAGAPKVGKSFFMAQLGF